MKIRLIILVILICGALGGAFFYWKLNSADTDIHKLIPETSLAVIQGANLDASFKSFEQYAWFNTLLEIPALGQFQQWTKALEALESAGTLQSNLTQLPYWISLHSTGSDDFQPLIITRSKGFNWKIENIKTVVEKIAGTTFTLTQQVFKDQTLFLLKDTEQQLVFLIQDGFLAFSENSVLLEDVIRAIEDEENRLLKENDLIEDSDEVSVLLNNARLGEWQELFFEKPELSSSLMTTGISSLQLIPDENGLRITGLSSLQINRERVSDEPELFAKNLIPLVATEFSWQKTQPANTELAKQIGDELLTVGLDLNFGAPAEVFLFQVEDTARTHALLDARAEAVKSAVDSIIYRERYLNTTIGFLNDKSFWETLLDAPSLASGAPYYATFQNNLILSSDLNALKTVMDDFDREATWGKSVTYRQMLDDLVQQASATKLTEFRYAVDPMMNRLKPKWKTFLTENTGLRTLVNRVIWQANRTNQRYLLSAEVMFNATETQRNDVDKGQELNTPRLKYNVFADTLITSPIFIVKNHNTQAQELMFQDAALDLYLTTAQGEVLWKKTLPKPLLTDVVQVDFYQNRFLQYLFYTDSLVHLVDRNGQDVDGFPKPYNQPLSLEGAAVIDYDKSKRYRFLTFNRRGAIILNDKNFEGLEGWNPKSFGGPLLKAPFHLRVRGKDAFVVVEKQGTIHLLNRKGEAYPGFPVDLDLRLGGDIHLAKGPDFESTELIVSSDEGKIVGLNLLGQRTIDKQLVNPDTRTTFALVSDVLNTGFRVLRSNQDGWSMVDSNGTVLFDFQQAHSNALTVKFYNFRNGNEIYAILDREERLVYLMNRQGELMNEPLPADHQVNILFYQNAMEYEVFVNFANQVTIYGIQAQ